MNENGRKRREWIKSAAIVFLTILLILTFFSNTIMNYSLPEVAAQYIQSGTITAKIRGYGVIESGDPYSVKISGTRVVESVEVRVGDEVEKGTVLCVLSSEDSTELEAAKEALKQAQAAFDAALLTGNLDSDVMNNAGKSDSVKNYKAMITKVQNEIEAAEAEVETAQENVKQAEEWNNALSLQIDLENASTLDTKTEQKAVDDAKAALNVAEAVLADAQKLVEEIEEQISNSVSGGDSTVSDTLLKEKEEAVKKVADAQKARDTAQASYDKAAEALSKKVESYDKDTIIANLTKQQAQAQISIRDANKVLTEKQNALKEKQDEKEELIKNIGDERNLSQLDEAVETARAEVKKLEEKIGGSEVVAPITGTITAVNVKSGLDTPQDGIVFTMQPEGEGYTMSFSVSNDQAKRLSVGDIAEPVNSWRYNDILIVLDSIRPDPSNPSQNKILNFNVSGEDAVANQSMNISVGQKSATFDMIVPNSAIREDNNGKFILIVESKQSPIGTRYTANRVDVEVLASDDTQSAINGALQGWEFVITTSTKPVEAGQQVRLPE